MSNETENASSSNGATRVMEEPIDPDHQHASNDETNDDSRSADDLREGGSRRRSKKKDKVQWTQDLERRFLRAIDFMGFENAQPKKILGHMNVKDLTREQVASHLQKHRDQVKAARVRAFEAAYARNMAGNYGLRYMNNSGSQLGGYGLGQSSLMMMNGNVGGHGYNPYVNQYGSNLLPVNEEMRNINFGSSQGYQVPQYGHYGIPSSALGMNPYHANSLGFLNGPCPLNEEMRVFGTLQSQVPAFGQYNYPNGLGTSPESQVPGFGQYNYPNGLGTSPVSSQVPGIGHYGYPNVIRTSPESQVSGYGEYGFPSNFLGVNCAAPSSIPNISKGKRPLNDERRNISRASQAPESGNYGMTTNSFSGMNSNAPSNLGYLETLLLNEDIRTGRTGPSQVSQVPGIGQYYGTRSDVLGMNHYNPPNTHIGMRMPNNGVLVAPGKTKVIDNADVNGNGTVNASPGESCSDFKWTFLNNENSPGSSSATLPCTFSSLLADDNQIPSHFYAETDGKVPVLETPSMVNDHAVNPPANQDKDNTHIGMRMPNNGFLVAPGKTKVIGNANVNGNGTVNDASPGESWSDPNNENSPGSSSTTLPCTFSSLLADDNQIPSHFYAETDGEVPVLETPSMVIPPANQDKDKGKKIVESFDVSFGDIDMNEILAAYASEDNTNRSFDNGTSDDEMLKFIAATPTEMYLPTNDMDLINQQEHGSADLTKLPLLVNKECGIADSTRRPQPVDKEHGFADSTQLSLPVDKEQGYADIIHLPLSVEKGLIPNEEFMNFVSAHFPEFV